MVAILIALPYNSMSGQQPDEVQGRTSPIAISGGAELETIRIVRWKASYAAKEADLTNMEIRLWLPGKWKDESKHHLVKFLDLKSIEDETGKLLSTNKRLEAIRYLKGEVEANGTMSFQGKEGPVIAFTLEAPARPASKIKSIKGKAEVSRATIASLRFGDVFSMRGKALEHPKLKVCPIRPTVEVENGETKVTLGVPDQSARLYDWWLEKDGKRLPLRGEGATLFDGKYVSGKTFRGDRIKEYSLRILLAEPVESKVFEFDFKNVELP